MKHPKRYGVLSLVTGGFSVAALIPGVFTNVIAMYFFYFLGFLAIISGIISLMKKEQLKWVAVAGILSGGIVLAHFLVLWLAFK